MTAGGGIRIKFGNGSVESVAPVAPEATHVAALEARIVELEADVRRWKFNAEEAERQRVATVENMRRAAGDNEVTLNRVRTLVSRTRKTLRMADLVTALGWSK